MTDELEMKASHAAGIVVDQSRSRSRGGCELFCVRFDCEEETEEVANISSVGYFIGRVEQQKDD